MFTVALLAGCVTAGAPDPPLNKSHTFTLLNTAPMGAPKSAARRGLAAMRTLCPPGFQVPGTDVVRSSAPSQYSLSRELPAPSGPHSSRKRYVDAGSHESCAVSGSV